MYFFFLSFSFHPFFLLLFFFFLIYELLDVVVMFRFTCLSRRTDVLLVKLVYLCSFGSKHILLVRKVRGTN